MAYIVEDSELGFVDLYLIDTVGPGPLKLAGSSVSYGRFEYPGIELKGIDPVLGGGTFVFAQFGGTVAAGGWVELSATNVNSNARYDLTATAWAGTTITGKPLAVALSAGASGQWGWFQVQGIAVANTNGTVAAGDKQFWQASGVSSSTVVASKQIVNVTAASANNATYGTGTGAVTLSGQSLIYLNRPFAQGAIT